MRVGMLGLLLLASTVAHAQSSASFDVSEWVIDNGGEPRDGVPLASARFLVTAVAIGGSVPSAGLVSGSFGVDSGFLSLQAPPGEANSLVFSSKSELSWANERSAGTYNVYRDALTDLAGAGACFASALTQPGATDVELPGAGEGFFYLVTVRNRLEEEGTKGQHSDGTVRPNSGPCP